MTGDRDARISGYLDGELDDQERAAFEADLERSPELTRELEAIRRMKSITESVTFVEFPDRTWDEYWSDTYFRMERKVGWILVSLGAIIVTAAALFQVVPEFVSWLVADTDPWYLRLGVLLLVVGGAVLIVSILRERVFRSRRDPYRKVIR